MADIEATADPRTGSVELKLSTVVGVQGILRSDVNGTRPVRLRAGDLDGTGSRILTDYEPALHDRVLYRVLKPSAPAQVWVDMSAAKLPRFLVPSVPQFSVVAQSVTAYNATRRSRSKFHEVIGRSSPLVAAARMTPRTGSLEAACETYAEAQDLVDVLERGQTLMYRQSEHAGLDMYFQSESVSITAEPEEEQWKLGIDFVEVAFPVGNVLGRSPWTFDALAQSYASFDDVATGFDTFHDLTIAEETKQ